MAVSDQERDNTVARLRFGLHELEHGVGSVIPEPVSVMLGALTRWRIGVLEADANAEALGGDVIKAIHPSDDTIIDAEFREVP